MVVRLGNLGAASSPVFGGLCEVFTVWCRFGYVFSCHSRVQSHVECVVLALILRIAGVDFELESDQFV